MDDLKIDARAYDPAYVNAMIREARRMRNAALADMVKALFDGRLMTGLTGERKAPSNDLPHGAAPQG